MRWLMARRQAGIVTCLAILASVTTAVPSDAAADKARDLLEIDQKNFSRSTMIDNKWMPLQPGTQLVFEGSAVEDRERVPRRLVFTVTDLVKVIDGIPTVVVLDKDFVADKLQEQELTFFAQDDAGNVWQLGEHSETYEETQFIGSRGWIVGHLKGAKAGIMMQAQPREGTPSYSEGFSPPPDRWTDRGRVRTLGGKAKVPAGTYDDVLLIEEFSQEEPSALQLKYYAPGVGNIRVSWESKDPKKETLELVRVVHLGPQDMAEAAAEAFKIEERAYAYGSTQPAKRMTR